MQDVPLLNVRSGRPYAQAEVTISVREYPENYKNSNFKRHFLKKHLIVSPRNLHDNLEVQIQWHISNIYVFILLTL